MEKSASGQVYRYPPASGLLLGAGLVGYCATLLLLVSFASPYWLESYQEANMEFVRLGLWDVCFHNYRHPSYQYDETFNGCHWIHSYAYQNIRDWLLPGWLMFVQSMMTLALMFALGALVLLSVVLMRYMLRFEIIFLLGAFILEAITGRRRLIRQRAFTFSLPTAPQSEERAPTADRHNPLSSVARLTATLTGQQTVVLPSCLLARPLAIA
ncbi:uncharacterized protein LOC119450930 isoform X3 [Dermacentor silvarum]|uniref:uncharacterized protein LOC119450930 isoform X3 n=1 Tax=Dermacentor silvarum TaxID=543639 RepID=UPI002100B6CD|nr:uncharacterized protein LOC119450930 isoform X3 [Dermacentor silvarum]